MNATALKESAAYPWDSGDTGRLLVLGGVLTLLSPLLLPAFVVLGIGIRVIEAVIDRNTSPPTIEDWSETTVDGLKAAVVVFVYSIVPLAVGTALIVVILGAVGFRTGRGVPIPSELVGAGGLAVVFGLLAGGLALAVLYVTPAALVHLARTRRLGAAFAFDEVRALAAADSYASAWLLALVVFAANGVVLAVLSVTPAGFLLNGFVSFYAFLAMSSLYARGAREAGFRTDTSRSSTSVADDEPATDDDSDDEPTTDDEPSTDDDSDDEPSTGDAS